MMLPGPEAGVELQADTVLPGPGASMRVVNHMSAHGRQPDVDAAVRNISPMTVHIPIKLKWFDEISSGKKFHEYRRMCDHWTRRLFVSVQGMEPVAVKYALFRVGYASNTSALLVRVIKITEIKARDIPAGMSQRDEARRRRRVRHGDRAHGFVPQRSQASAAALAAAVRQQRERGAEA